MFVVRYPHTSVDRSPEYITFDRAVEVGREYIRGRYTWFEIYNVDVVNGKRIYKLFVRVYK